MSFLKSLIVAVYGFFFGCSHERVTRPFTISTRTYKVCLDCGSELPYSLESMHLAPRRIRRAARAAMPSVVPQRTAKVLAFGPAPVRNGSPLNSKIAA